MRERIYEDDVSTSADVTRFLIEEVLSEYHGFPVVDNKGTMYIKINDTWWELFISKATGAALADLEKRE